MDLPRISRLHLLPVLFTISLVNPFTYYVLHTSRTYFWVIPLTLVIWLGFKWKELERDAELKRCPRLWEIALGIVLIAGIVVRGLLQEPSGRIFGLFDMLIVFIALCLMLFGYRSIRRFWVPASFFAIIGVGYSLERAIVDSMGYAEVLAGMVTFLVKSLGANVTNEGAEIILSTPGNGRLLIDYGCTGIKGILAFAFIACIPIVESKQNGGRKTAWIALALVGFYVASVLRLVAVVFAVLAWGQIAVDYHTTIGFGFFMAWLILVTYYGSAPSGAGKAGEASLRSELS